jgi:Putative bacterial sensory transduction regulator
VERNDRIAMYEAVLDIFLSGAKEKGHVTFETSSDRDQYVQFQLHSGRVYGEVGSRQWQEPERPLSAAAVASLERLGFSGGGPERNYAKDGLPASKNELAELTDSLFMAAYELDDGFSPVVHVLNLNDITLPRAQQFTRDMIEAHLKDVGVRYLSDGDGDFRVDVPCDGWEQPLVVWLMADGAGDTVYRITSSMPVLPQTWTRLETLERCNTWNREHRWPKAAVLDHGGDFCVVASNDIDFAEGVTPALLADFTHDVVHSAMEFWGWLARSDQPASADSDRENGETS